MNRLQYNKLESSYQKKLRQLKEEVENISLEINAKVLELGALAQAVDQEKIKKRELETQNNAMESEYRVLKGKIESDEKTIKETKEIAGKKVVKQDAEFNRLIKDIDKLETKKSILNVDIQIQKDEIELLKLDLDKKEDLKRYIGDLKLEKSRIDVEIKNGKKVIEKQQKEFEKEKKEMIENVEKIQRESENIHEQYKVIQFYARRLVKYFTEIKASVPQELQDIKPIKIFRSQKLINKLQNGKKIS